MRSLIENFSSSDLTASLSLIRMGLPFYLEFAASRWGCPYIMDLPLYGGFSIFWGGVILYFMIAIEGEEALAA